MQAENTNQINKIHGVVFKEKLPSKLKKMLNDQNISKVLSDGQWWLGTFYSRKGWDYIFDFIIQTSVIMLNLSQNAHNQILLQISKPNFTQLRILLLWSNKIQSIEQLQFINMPLLIQLYLLDNKITNVKALNKCVWNSLRDLNLNLNPIEQFVVQRIQTIVGNQKQINKNIKSQLQLTSQCKGLSGMAKLTFNKLSWSYPFELNQKFYESQLGKCIQRKNLDLTKN